MHKSRRGFNLLEVTIAAFLFSTIAVAFLGVWGMQVRGVEKSRHSLVATLLAEQRIEEIMSDGYELTPVTDGMKEEETIKMAMELRGANGEWSTIDVEYQPYIQVEDYEEEAGDKLRLVTVKVTWKDTSGGGEVVLVTYLAGVF